jgi:hypothetical protein
MYISNLGDSLAFVASYDRAPPSSTANATPENVQIIYKTKPHKPDTPSERKRIEAAGGQVEDPFFPGATARLLIPMPNNRDMFGLAMSRSLGDHDGTPFGLIAEPTTDVLDLTKLDTTNKEYFVVAVTDGLVDNGKLSATEVAERIAKSFFLSNEYSLRGSTNSELPLQAAEQLILEASQKWREDPQTLGYRDDISIALRRIIL